MSEARGDDYLESVYLFGTPEEIVGKLQARVDAGVEYFVLHTMTPDPAQLELWLRDVIPHVMFPARAGAAAAAHQL
jgi:alkanesulfonate monooxygenase SsuD/methylene tetrahydromethanopterin reductase-like flavin-dependent oxidoreductase (luciferase family)